jgi:16S rRNA (guanine527-N7)-methyltransferase
MLGTFLYKESFFAMPDDIQNMLNVYKSCLVKWNKSCDLVQEDTLACFLERHVTDSLQILRFLRNSDRIVDIGSGGGFPGIVLSIYGQKGIVLVEKSYKKARFLSGVVNQLKLDTEVFCGNINDFDGNMYTCISRAFGSLTDLLNVMVDIKACNGVFHKGRTYRQEVFAAKKHFLFDCEINTSITDSKSAIIEVGNVRRANG